jgi:hypothetical protein
MIQVTFLRDGKLPSETETGFFHDHSRALQSVIAALDSEMGGEFIAVLMPRVGSDFQPEFDGPLIEYSVEEVRQLAALIPPERTP